MPVHKAFIITYMLSHPGLVHKAYITTYMLSHPGLVHNSFSWLPFHFGLGAPKTAAPMDYVTVDQFKLRAGQCSSTGLPDS